MKADIFHAYIALLKQTKSSVGAGRDDPSGFGANQEIANMLVQQVPLIVKATSKQMKVTLHVGLLFRNPVNTISFTGQELENAPRGPISTY